MMRNQNNTSLLINFFFIFSCFIIHLSHSDETVVSSWYKTQIIETVIPPYSNAYTTLNEKIVQQLLKVDIDSNETILRTLIDSLVCASRNIQNKLGVAATASERIRNSLDEQITQLILSITNQEHKVRESQQSVDEANVNIQHTQKQVTLAENAVQEKQHALNTAEHDMREAQKAVDRARLCGRRRRKRGFGKWWRKKVEKPFVKIVRQTVIRPVCSVVNAGGIDNAKERRTLAGHTLHEAQQRLIQHQQNLAHQHAQHATAQTQLNAANSQLNILTTQLREEQARQTVISLLVKQLKGVEIHLKTVLGSSTVLEDAIRELINFELVIEPLNTIYHEMLTNNVMTSFTFEISAEMTATILTNLKVLSDKMPKMPLNEIIVEETSINCV